MFKKAFTLQEVLVTLGIIGVIAALGMPAVTKIKPDAVKLRYIKALKTIQDVTEDIITDNTLYYPTSYTTDSSGRTKPGCSGLSCGLTSTDFADLIAVHPNLKVNNTNFSSSSNIAWKFPVLFASKLNLKQNITCSGTKCELTATDGTWFQFEGKNVSANSTSLYYDIIIDVDPSSTVDNVCSSNVKNPDRFKIQIDLNGNVKPNDNLGIQFLKHPTNVRMAKEDRKAAGCKQ